jgi:hypothetical protein
MKPHFRLSFEIFEIAWKWASSFWIQLFKASCRLSRNWKIVSAFGSAASVRGEAFIIQCSRASVMLPVWLDAGTGSVIWLCMMAGQAISFLELAERIIALYV